MKRKSILICIGALTVLVGILLILQWQSKQERNWLEKKETNKPSNMAAIETRDNSDAYETTLLSIEEDGGLRERLSQEEWDSFYWRLEAWLIDQKEGRRRGNIIMLQEDEGFQFSFRFLHEDITKEFHQIGCRIYPEEDRYEFAYE